MVDELRGRVRREGLIGDGFAGTGFDATADVCLLGFLEEDFVGGSLGHRPVKADLISVARGSEIGHRLG